MNGPIINKTKNHFTTRDSLGIENVATTLSRDACPVVNTVTPRPFYWALIDWCYYDWYKNHNEEERTRAKVNEYIKKTNYFVALGNILANGYTDAAFTGSSNINQNYDRNAELFSFDDSYLQKTGAMNYYPAGLDSMKMVVSSDDTTNFNEKPKLTDTDRGDGVALAKAFDKIISQTEFYKEYRFKSKDIPKAVLTELASIVTIDLAAFDECKTILKRNLFELNALYSLNLKDCKDYINYVKASYGIDLDTNAKCREVFYDYFSSKGLNYQLPDELKNVALKWETIIGRQYLTIGLEILWKYMLEMLNGIYTSEEWIGYCLKQPNDFFELEADLSSIVAEQHYSFDVREKIINDERLSKETNPNSVASALRIILSVYNRFSKRNDINVDYLNNGGSRSVSMSQAFDTIDNYLDRPIRDFLIFIMDNYLIKQHLTTAFYKMIEGRNGYYIEEVDGRFIRKHHFDLGFQGIRMVQLHSVMNDLGVLNG